MASTQRGTPSPERIPVLPIRSTVVFPGGATALQIGYGPNIEALIAHPDAELEVATVSTVEDSFPLDPRSLEKVATVARVLDRINLPGGTIQTTLQGLRRVRLSDVRLEDGFYTAVPVPVDEPPNAPSEETERLVERILNAVSGVAAMGERLSDEVARVLRMNLSDCGRFADLAATLCHFSVPERDAVLQTIDVEERLRVVLAALEAELEELGPETAPAEPAPAESLPAGAHERQGELRKRIQALQAELGELDPMEREATEILRRVERSALPQRIAVVARREAERLRSVGVTSGEATEIRAYLDALVSVPWGRGRGTEIEVRRVEAAIEAEHLGLDEAKERLLEVIAVAELRGDLCGPMPCLVGPPGVGKRTLAAAIARGLDRPFIRLELGGRGEAQLVGSRRARSGSEMGKIMSAIRDAGRPDVVFFLEEIDEIGLGNVEGDPVEALEEALDPENRDEFVDRYLDLPFDLSQVLFIASAADFYRIPRDLRDLFIEIRIAGYTPEEKIAIARDWLLPRVVRDHGLPEGSVEVSDDTLLYLTRGYARDAGVGNLRRSLAAILRAIALDRAENAEHARWTITREMIETVLGYPRYSTTLAEKRPEIGVVTGLAWTASGGELMFIEALKMPGTGRLIITGLLGDVMRESVNAAFSYVRSRADTLGIDHGAFSEHDIHVHFPVGATPKDGPSAGAAVTLAIASSLADRPVRHDLAMTGEVTLRGKILEIGGLKEKTLAAYRAGLRELIIPAGNRRDLRDVPADVRDGITFHFVERMDEVFDIAFADRGEPAPAAVAPPSREPERQAAAGAEPGE